MKGFEDLLKRTERFFVFNVCECSAYMYTCALWRPEEAIGFPGTGVNGWLWATMWLLELELGSSSVGKGRLLFIPCCSAPK